MQLKKLLTEFLSLDHKQMLLTGQALFVEEELCCIHRRFQREVCPNLKENDPFYFIRNIRML